jgi:hypothetical protein
MPAKPIPYGLDDYKSLITEGYAYVDKTMHIRTLEAGLYNMFLRPRRFGKSLFASTLGYYYDIAEKDNFDLLFSGTDIGQNPTKKKNTYYILKFDFSGIETNSDEILLESFTNKVYYALRNFRRVYKLDLTLKMDRPAAQLTAFFTEFQEQCNGKIYVIIDEYDNFANELLSSNFESYKKIVTEDGFVRKWYAGLKRVSGTIVDRIFITGVSPITLDSLTSGFNNATNLSMDSHFNEMMGFTRSEVEQLIRETISEELPADLMDTLTDYYNGYCFSEDGKEHVFNSDMVLYYLKHYQRHHKPPRTLLSRNAVSDYGKLEGLITFQANEDNFEILKEIVFEGYTVAELTESFTIGEEFTSEHLKSLLFYLGLLTIKETDLGAARLQIPNLVMNGLYFKFLLKIITREADYIPNTKHITNAMVKLARENSCTEFIAVVEDLLNSISNRDSQRFSEAQIKIAMAAYAGISQLYLVKSEYEVEKQYVDLVFFPQDKRAGLDTLLFELKYIKKEDVADPNSESGKKIIAGKLAEAEKQLQKYSSAKEFRKAICWALVFVGDKCVAHASLPRGPR